MTFVLILLFMVLVFWRPQDWLFPWLYGWPMLDVIFYVALLTFVVEKDSGQIRLPRRYPQPALLAGLFVACMMSHVAHTYLQGMLNSFAPVLKICFFTVVLFCVLDKPRRLRAVVWVFVVMACIMAVHAILQEQRGFGFRGVRPMFIGALRGNPAHTRSFFFGIFEDPNDLAQILATSIPFAFVMFRRRTPFNFLLSCGVAVLLFRAILTTHSRGGQVALAAVAGVLVILMLPKRWLPFGMGAMLLGALFLCPFSAGVLDMSAYERVVFWGLANEQFKHNLLFGLGYGMFWQVANSRASHNAFVGCYTEIGLFGYWFWFVLIVIGFVGAWRVLLLVDKSESLEHAWLRRMAGMGIAAMTGFCASAYFLSRAFVYPMFFLMAILGSIPRMAEDISLEEDTAPLIDSRRDVMVLGSVATIISVVYIYFSIVFLNKAIGM